jgi:hypothetical protein
VTSRMGTGKSLKFFGQCSDLFMHFNNMDAWDTVIAIAFFHRQNRRDIGTFCSVLGLNKDFRGVTFATISYTEKSAPYSLGISIA